MLPIKRVDHVSFATHSIDASLKWFETIFGARETQRMRVESEGYTFATLQFPGGQLEWELIEPLGDNSFVAKFLRDRGPGVHHITVQVEDVQRSAEMLRANGIEPFGGVSGADGWRETFIHPRDSGGILFQLFEGHE